jgi:hypothetical protein
MQIVQDCSLVSEAYSHNETQMDGTWISTFPPKGDSNVYGNTIILSKGLRCAVSSSTIPSFRLPNYTILSQHSPRKTKTFLAGEVEVEPLARGNDSLLANQLCIQQYHYHEHDGRPNQTKEEEEARRQVREWQYQQCEQRQEGRFPIHFYFRLAY